MTDRDELVTAVAEALCINDGGKGLDTCGGSHFHRQDASIAVDVTLRTLEQRLDTPQRSPEARQTPQKVGDVTTDPGPQTGPQKAPYGQPQQHQRNPDQQPPAQQQAHNQVADQ